jgi:hypothetical protein
MLVLRDRSCGSTVLAPGYRPQSRAKVTAQGEAGDEYPLRPMVHFQCVLIVDGSPGEPERIARRV